MSFPKPLTPVLQSGHGFASGLQAAWLFTDGSGVTVKDWSGNNRHLMCTNVTNGSWSVTGATETCLRFGLGAAKSGATPGAVAGLNFATDTHAWTEIFMMRLRGGSGIKPRIRTRTADVIDFACLVGGDRRFEYFSGSSWIDMQATSQSGADECWAFVHGSNSVLSLYKNGVQVITGLGGAGVNNTGQIYFWTAPDDVTVEYTEGDMVAAFILNRALSDNEVASHYSDPFGAFIEPPAGPSNPLHFSPPTFTTLVPSHGYEGSYYESGPSPPDMQDWLGGA